MKKISAFKIRLLKSHTSPFDLSEGDEILRICGCDSLNPFKFNVIEADPFLFVYGERLYLFYESLEWGGKGVIKMIWTEDLTQWSDPVVVLEEKCHLSYPFVFEDSLTKEVYMIPETSQLKEIRLYKASSPGLTGFKYFKTLLMDSDEKSEVSFSDSSIYRHQGIYYLHTSRLVDGENNLELYYSTSLLGPFSKHPLSPILKNMKFGRNAGSLFSYKGRLFRPAMNCICGYGDAVGLFEIQEMSEINYKEHLVNENLLAGKNEYYKDGSHHFNMVMFRDIFIISTDARSWKIYFLRRLVDKISSLCN